MHRGKRTGDRLSDRQLEVAVAASGKLRFDLRVGLAGEGGIDRHEVVDPVLALSAADLCPGIGDGAPELSHDIVAGIENAHRGILICVGFAHLLIRLGKRHNFRPRLGNKPLRHSEGIAVYLIEPCRNVAGYLNVLHLVYPHRHKVGLIKQDIRRHERRVSEKPCVYVRGILFALVLELRHARKLAEHRVAVQHPCKLCMSRNMALHEQRVLLRVKPACDIKRQRLVCALSQLCGVLSHRYRMKIDHAVKAVVCVLKFAPVLYRTEVVSDREHSARLNPGEYFLFCFRPILFHIVIVLPVDILPIILSHCGSGCNRKY